MNQNILLTFEHVKEYTTYAWFETEEDVKHFIENSVEIKEVNECFDCSNVREIEL